MSRINFNKKYSFNKIPMSRVIQTYGVKNLDYLKDLKDEIKVPKTIKNLKLGNMTKIGIISMVGLYTSIKSLDYI